MRAGPKGSVAVAPLQFRRWPRDRAKRRERFIREFLTVPRGHGVGKPFRLRDFQREIVRGAFAEGVRTALVSIPRANGKTMLAAALALAELFVGPPSAEVLVVASDQRQANITFRYAKRMVELNPILAERVQVYADRLYLPRMTPLCCLSRLNLAHCTDTIRACSLSMSCTWSLRACGRRLRRWPVSVPSR